MSTAKAANILVENHVITSEFLNRDVKVDFYFPPTNTDPTNLSLLLVNDGQDLVKMQFENILDNLYAAKEIDNV